MTEVFGPFFLVWSSVKNLMEQLIRVQKLFWQVLWNLKEHVFGTYEVVENANFWTKRQALQWRKCFGLFSRNIEHDKPQRTTYKGTQGILMSLLQAIWSFF